jgi:hypothetical protein
MRPIKPKKAIMTPENLLTHCNPAIMRNRSLGRILLLPLRNMFSNMITFVQDRAQIVGAG